MTVTGYIPKNELVERHEQGVTKGRKTIMTGGGRAWSEAEEQYLVRTRLQKVPYKQIAANLKKTELACRLHYHQLTHSSARRRHSVSTTSPVSASMSSRPAEMMTVTILGGAGAAHHHHRSTGSVSSSAAHRRAESYSSTSTASSGDNVQLPRIVDAWASSPPTLPVILPRPSSMVGETAGSRPLPRLHEELCHLPPPPHQQQHQQYYPSQQQQHHQHHMERPGFPLPSTSTHPPSHVDITRLHALYDVHRDAFWHAIARDYGWNASPAVLESAWRDSQRKAAATPDRPITPEDSPEAPARRDSVEDRTSIASLLTDASPSRW